MRKAAEHRMASTLIFYPPHCRSMLLVGLVVVLAACNGNVSKTNNTAKKTSAFGEYSGYSEIRYEGIQRSSQYVAARDGTRLAVDVYRPAHNGKVVEEALPVVWVFTPYNRAIRTEDGRINPSGAVPMELVPYGYAVAIADVRGKGASFGVRQGPADINETQDAHDITEWLAAQPWSSGKVGMTGCSYYGATALQGLISGAPSIKAAFVGTTMFDQYGTFAAGGITSDGLLDDTVSAERVAQVDEDPERHLLAQALEQHAGNTPTGRFFAATPFRDDVNPYTDTRWWIESSLYPHLDLIRPDVGIYVYGGYYDVYADQTIYKYINLPVAKKLAFGNWPHCDTPGFRLDLERRRFFDYWLKGIDNGIMEEPPVHVYVTRAKDGTEWRALEGWPQGERASYFLHTEPRFKNRSRGPQRPLIRGSLQAEVPEAGSTVLDDVPAIQPLRVYSMPRAGADLYSATYTLPRQSESREIIGIPSTHLWISTPAEDADVYVYLEVVRSMGGSLIISQGVLRASHRYSGEAPYDVRGLPWQTHTRADVRPLQPNEPVLLNIAMSPTAYVVRSGDALRLAVTTRPPDEHAPNPPPLTIWSGGEHASYLEVPFTDTRDRAISRDEVAEKLPASFE